MEWKMGKFYKIVPDNGDWAVVQVVPNDKRFATDDSILGSIILAKSEDMINRHLMLNSYTESRFEVTEYKEPTRIKYTPEICDLFLHIAVELDDELWFNDLHEKKRRMVKNV